MSMKALNHLLGRSAIDPAVKQAFDEGRILDLLAEHEFAPDLWNKLAALRAEDFSDYAVLAYRMVQEYERAQEELRVPSPLVGLTPKPEYVPAEEQAA
jgi:hypothetical protein